MIDHKADRRAEQENLPRLFYITALGVLIGYLMWIGQNLLIPFVIATFLSFLIVTLKTTLKTRTGPVGRHLPDWFLYILTFLIIAIGLMLLADIIRDNTEALIASAPAYRDNLAAISGHFVTWMQQFSFVPTEFSGTVETIRLGALERLPSVLTGLGNMVRAFATNLITILLYTIFMLFERGNLIKKLKLLSREKHEQEATEQILGDIGNLVRSYISIKTLINLCVATISFFIMTFLGVDFAGFWALLLFSLAFVPIIGSPIAIGLASLLALVQPDQGGIKLALLTLGGLYVVEQSFSSGIEPRLMGKSLNLSPLVILLSLGLWGTLWGFAGMLLCVPITVAIMIILSQFHTTRPVAILLSDNGDIAPIKRLETKNAPKKASPAHKIP
ncbi:MAG: AI-2E family transporter [Parvularculaceae bacterium]